MLSDPRRGPLLSLCIATLNRARYLGQTLQCIVSQADPDIEVVILDGGSSDETAQVVDSFRGSLPSLQYKRKSEPGGVDRDFDEAVELASGSYCWLMSDDDLLRPGTVRTVLTRLSGRALSVIVVNAAVYNEDFSELIHERMIEVAEDREYGSCDDERLFIDAARYLSYIGAVIVQRDLWRARARTPYYGSQFIHVGVLFQAPLPRVALLAEPLILIRYGNASWSARAFEIWMFKWPDLIWSFGRFSRHAKAAVCPREPWRDLKTLLLYRAKGAYSLREYRIWIKPRLQAEPIRWMALGVACLPGALINILAICGSVLLFRHARASLIDLRNSRYNVFKRLGL